MFRSVTYLAIGAALIAGAAVLVLGWDSVSTTVAGANKGVQEAFEEAKSDVQKAAELEVLLEKLGSDIEEHADKLAEVEERQEKWVGHGEQIEQELVKQQGILRRAKRMLDGTEDQFRIGGRSYTREELNEDALARVDHCKRLDQEATSARCVVEQLEGSVQQGRKALSQSHSQRRQLAAKLATLTARLGNARMMAEVNDAIAQLRSSPFEPQTKLARELARFESRVRDVERDLERKARTCQGDMIVDWEGGARPKDARSAITELLGNKSDHGLAARDH